MEQTFNDLWNERKHQAAGGLFGFVLWMFVETAIGIVQERVVLIKEMNSMKTILTHLSAAAIISLLIVLPFAILEFVFNILNKPSALNPKNLTSLTVLFGLMWLLPTVFIAILMPIVRNVRTGNNILENPIGLLLRVAFLIVIAMMWGGIVMDQLPCFLGVPNCD